MRKRNLLYFIPMVLCLVLAGFFLSLPGYRFLPLVFGGIALVILLYWLLLRKHRPVYKWLRRVLTAFLILGLILAAVTGFLVGRACLGSPSESCDYLIVLGAGVNGTTPSLSLRNRLDAAFAYLQANPDTICIVSGGQGPGEQITEAACMYQDLTVHGIDPARIWMEDKSTSTGENIAFSLNLIEEKTGSRPTQAGIVSSEYHLYRAGRIAAKEGLSAFGVPAKTSYLFLFLNYFLREIPVIWYYTLTGGI